MKNFVCLIFHIWLKIIRYILQRDSKNIFAAMFLRTSNRIYLLSHKLSLRSKLLETDYMLVE